MTSPNEFLMLFAQAREKPYGISIQTNSPKRLRQKLYAARQGHREATGDRTLDLCSVWIDPDNQDTAIWIIPRRLECLDHRVA
jgi:hypothetical protein